MDYSFKCSTQCSRYLHGFINCGPSVLRVVLSELEQLLTVTRCGVIGHRVTTKDLIMLGERLVGNPPKFVGVNWLN